MAVFRSGGVDALEPLADGNVGHPDTVRDTHSVGVAQADLPLEPSSEIHAHIIHQFARFAAIPLDTIGKMGLPT